MRKTDYLQFLLCCLLVASPALSAFAGDAEESQGDPDLSVEDIITARINRPAAVKSEAPASVSSAKSVAPSKPAKTRQTSTIPETKEFLSALEQKQAEVNEANMEIARLKDVIKRMVQANRNEQANMHYNMGCVYKAGRLYNKAESELLSALKLNPDDPAVHYNLGVLYDDDLNDKGKARKHYNEFLKLAPDDPDAAKVQEWLLVIPGK